MSREAHDKARELIALGRGRDSASPEQTWLQAHLEECAPCRGYAKEVDGALGALRSLTVTADFRLVRATQMQVRFHAARLRETRERMWLVGMACLGVGFSAAMTAPLLWQLFAWAGERAGLSSPLSQMSFIFFWIAPGLVVSALLLARGAHKAGEPR